MPVIVCLCLRMCSSLYLGWVCVCLDICVRVMSGVHVSVCVYQSRQNIHATMWVRVLKYSPPQFALQIYRPVWCITSPGCHHQHQYQDKWQVRYRHHFLNCLYYELARVLRVSSECARQRGLPFTEFTVSWRSLPFCKVYFQQWSAFWLPCPSSTSVEKATRARKYFHPISKRHVHSWQI